MEYEFCRNTGNTSAGCTSNGWGSTTGTTFTSLTNNQIYYYFVRSRDAFQNTSAWSASVNSRQDNTAPNVPTMTAEPAYTSGTQNTV